MINPSINKGRERAMPEKEGEKTLGKRRERAEWRRKI